MKKIPCVLGLLISSVAAAAYLIVIIASLFDKEPLAFGPEALGIVILTLLTAASVIFAWIRPKGGVWMVLVVGVLFAIFGVVTAGQNKWMAVVAAGGPLVLSSLLMFWGIHLEQGHRCSAGPGESDKNKLMALPPP